MPSTREIFEMVTKQTEPDVDAWRQQEARQRRAARSRKVGAFAVAATIGVAALALFLGTRPRDGAELVDEPPTVAPETTAEDVATSFLDAYGAFDADRR